MLELTSKGKWASAERQILIVDLTIKNGTLTLFYLHHKLLYEKFCESYFFYQQPRCMGEYFYYNNNTKQTVVREHNNRKPHHCGGGHSTGLYVDVENVDIYGVATINEKMANFKYRQF